MAIKISTPCRLAWITGVGAFALGLPIAAASVTVTHADQPIMSIYERRTRHVILQQWDISCGAATLATILRYQHGEPVTERDVALRMMGRAEYLDQPEIVRFRHGFSLLDMKQVAESFGYEATGLGNLTLQNLEERAPIIVPVDINDYRHFVVFLGRSEGRIVIADPAYGRRTLSVEAFAQSWIDYPQVGRVGLIVARRDGLIPPNELRPRSDDFRFLN